MQRPVMLFTNKETIAFAHIYNVEPAQEIIDTDFNGYRILPFDVFRERYATHFNNIVNSQQLAYESLMNGISLKYVLVMTNAHDGHGNILDMNNLPPENLFGAFINTILYLRLCKSGDIQLGTFFVSYKNPENPEKSIYRNIVTTNFLCFLPQVQYPDYLHIWKQYSLETQEIKPLLTFINKLEQKDLEKIHELSQATISFTRACNTSDLFYKITNFVTALECLLADDGKDGEISFKLRTRLVYLLGDASIAEFIPEIYNLRSNITHKGGFNKKFVKDFYKKHGANFSFKYLLEKIAILEDICRKTIMCYLEKFINEDNFDIQKTLSELNKAMFASLAKNNA